MVAQNSNPVKVIIEYWNRACDELSSLRFYSRALVKPDAAEKVLKARVIAYGIEVGMYLEELQDV